MAIGKRALALLFSVAVIFMTLGCASYARTDKPATQIRFGNEMAKKGHWREAAFRFKQAAEKDPKNAVAHNNFGIALEAAGDFAQALVEYKRALELAPKNSKIRANYTRFAEFYTSYTRTQGKAVPSAR